MNREIIFWGEYFHGFYEKQEQKVTRKTDWILWLIQYTERVPGKYLKCLRDSDGLYEIRIKTTFKEIRILTFFDTQKRMVILNCFYKKSQKTPWDQIKYGSTLKHEYLDFKKSKITK